MGLGGPVWHVSVASSSILANATALEIECRRQLNGVGDPAVGEWGEWTGRAFHLRRRLSPREQLRVGPVLDIRRTPEAWARAAQLGSLLAYAPAEAILEELGHDPPSSVP